MKSADVVAWFADLRKSVPVRAMDGAHLTQEAVSWQTSVAALLAAAFPPGHRVLVEWERASAAVERDRLPQGVIAQPLWRLATARWIAIRGVFDAAHQLVQDGKVEGFIDSIRAEAEDEVLEQAQTLLREDRVAAAAVLAGGALEVHLRRLCEKNGVAPAGSGSIEKYNGAIAQARNNGTTIYEKPEGSLVTSWGQLRNEAAHDPAKFSATRKRTDVQPMVDGVRSFISRFR